MSAPTCEGCTTPLAATESGWICPSGCPDHVAGRRYRDLPGATTARPRPAPAPAPAADERPLADVIPIAEGRLL